MPVTPPPNKSRKPAQRGRHGCPGRPGRPRKYKDHAEKQRAYREREKQKMANLRSQQQAAAAAEEPLMTPPALQADDVLSLLDEWMADDSGYEEQTWGELKAALDENRASARRLFSK
jgi:hypothetical protein